MVDINVKNYKNAVVHTIAVAYRELFWVRTIDVQKD